VHGSLLDLQGRLVSGEVKAYLRASKAYLRTWVYESSPAGTAEELSKFDLKNASVQRLPFHLATAVSLQRPSPFCHPEGNRGICSAPFVCPAPTGPQPPPIITKYSWKHQPPLCLSAFSGEVRGTADPSVALGMTKRGGSLHSKGGC
jgi:hypothetical protein